MKKHFCNANVQTLDQIKYRQNRDRLKAGLFQLSATLAAGLGFFTAASVALGFLALYPAFAGDTSVPITPAPETSTVECPLRESAETQLDCPWAGVTRTLEAKIKADSLTSSLFWKALKSLRPQLRTLSKDGAILSLWGESVNFDEFAKAVIVPEKLLGEFLNEAGVASGRPCSKPLAQRADSSPVTQDRGEPKLCAHAGITHTYGYLLSNLSTPFGYKRKRWVSSEIESGLGLPQKSLSPLPPSGTLMGNATFVAKLIATGTPPPKSSSISAELYSWAPDLSKRLRLSEVVQLSNNSKNQAKPTTLTLQTDFIPFDIKISATPGANSHLLVYSYFVDATGHQGSPASGQGPKIITLFPVQTSFVQKALSPEVCDQMGEVFTRYNAWVPEIGNQRVRGMKKCNKGI